MTIFIIIYSIIIIMILAAFASQSEWNKLNNYFNNPEKLVAIVRVPFSVARITYSGGDYDARATNHGTSNHYADVYCYEKENGKRTLVINAYNFTGSHSFVKSNEIYTRLLDWKHGRSNLFNFPSYRQVLNGSSIIENK
jgi:hypothetical protein